MNCKDDAVIDALLHQISHANSWKVTTVLGTTSVSVNIIVRSIEINKQENYCWRIFWNAKMIMMHRFIYSHYQFMEHAN